MKLTSLNEIADEWRTFLSTLNVSYRVFGDAECIPGTLSVYSLCIDLIGRKSQKTFYYVGKTSDALQKRVSNHYSDIKTCRVTTFNGKSKLFSPENFRNCDTVEITGILLKSGLNGVEASVQEYEYAQAYRSLYGDLCLSTPSKPLKAYSLKASSSSFSASSSSSSGPIQPMASVG